jgi:CubicO group peptidase (beta-lactamase class C family)
MRHLVFSTAVVTLLQLGTLSAVQAQSRYDWELGNTIAEHDNWFKKVKAQNSRIVYVNTFNLLGTTRVTGVATNTPDFKWFVHGNRTENQLMQLNRDYKSQGFRMTSFSGYLSNNSMRYFATWSTEKDAIDGVPVIGLNGRAGYESSLAAQKKKNMVPVTVASSPTSKGSYHLFSLFATADPANWSERHDLTAAQYQQLLKECEKTKFRPNSVAVYGTRDGLRFATTLVKDGKEGRAEYGLSVKSCDSRINELQKEGFRPISISGYLDGTPASPAIFDVAMRTYMEQHGVKSGTLAVSREGNLLFGRGYGPADADGRRQMAVTDPMRIGGLSRVITGIAVRQLVKAGKLALDTKVFPFLGLKAPPGRTPDPRINDITVSHLIQANEGWDPKGAPALISGDLDIAAELRIPSPPGPADLVRYIMVQPLLSDPGSKAGCPRYTYCVLGRVIEKASGETYLAYVKNHILNPIGAKSVDLARSLPQFRNPLEPVYRDNETKPNVFDSENRRDVPRPDGSCCLEAMDSSGGLIASAPDLIRLLESYWLSTGEPRAGDANSYVEIANIPGSSAYVAQYKNGVNVVALFNQGINMTGKDGKDLNSLMSKAAEQLPGVEVRFSVVWVKEP